MNRHHGPLWLVLVSMMLCLPASLGVLAPDNPDLIPVEESRRPAPAPVWPRSGAEFLDWPAAADAWLRDHFGLRREMIHAHSLIAGRWLGGDTPYVFIGQDGWLYFRGQHMLAQSAGFMLREADVAETAEFVTQLHASLAARGIRFIVGIPPNASTIYPEHLPKWARNDGRRTENDALLEALHARGVPAVDLRPPLWAARATHDVYHHRDTHWNPRGALIGFNTIAAAAGHADWQFDPDAVLSVPVAQSGGDLANMLGFGTDISEETPFLTFSAGREDTLEEPPFRTFRATPTGTDAKSRLMIVGDSFTADYFMPMVLARTNPVLWTANFMCAFDTRWFDKFHPAEVWWMPTERQMFCSSPNRK